MPGTGDACYAARFVLIHSFHKGELVESISEIHTDAPADERADAPENADAVETIAQGDVQDAAPEAPDEVEGAAVEAEPTEAEPTEAEPSEAPADIVEAAP